MPEFFGGAINGNGQRVVKVRDMQDLRDWFTQYENSSWAAAHRARVYQQYDAYDGTSQFGIGKRTALWDGAGKQVFTYDKAGRLTKDDRQVDGATYTTQTNYDALDRVYQLTYPDNEVLTHTYGSHGLLTQVSSSTGTTLLSGAQYNALALPTQYTLGSGPTAQVRHTYNGLDTPLTTAPFGALKTIQFQQGTGATR